MGAVIDQRAFDKITGYINRAEKAGDAQVVLGGSFDDTKGYFVHPTVIETSNPHYESMTEEIFGPVLTVLSLR
jgi:1-pyrroline-5-carboxylate dehydrogenase